MQLWGSNTKHGKEKEKEKEREGKREEKRNTLTGRESGKGWQNGVAHQSILR